MMVFLDLHLLNNIKIYVIIKNPKKYSYYKLKIIIVFFIITKIYINYIKCLFIFFYFKFN